jgi:hypothetical protein
VLDLTPEALGIFRIPLLGASLALLLGPGANWIFRKLRRPFAGNVALVGMMVVLLACIHSAYITFSPILSSYNLAVAIQKHFRPGDVIVIDGRYDQASTLNFYIGVPVHVLHAPSGNLWYGAKFPDAPKLFETQESFASLWKSPTTVFMWADNEQPRALSGMKAFQLARSGGKLVFTNHDPTTEIPR